MFWNLAYLVFELVAFLHDVEEQFPHGEDNVLSSDVLNSLDPYALDTVPQNLEANSNWIASEIVFSVEHKVNLLELVF